MLRYTTRVVFDGQKWCREEKKILFFCRLKISNAGFELANKRFFSSLPFFGFAMFIKPEEGFYFYFFLLLVFLF